MCMRTTIEIDDGVMRAAQEVLGTKSKRETVDRALREVVAREQRRAFRELRGKVEWEGDLSEMRKGREWSL